MTAPATFTLNPRTDPVEVWQFTGQSALAWPDWVRACCTLVREDDKPALRHGRWSGAQLVYQGEWLVRDDAGEVVYYENHELYHKFYTDRMV